jgi:Protein of unknown function (DUF2442)
MMANEETQNHASGKALDEASGQAQILEQRAKTDREADRRGIRADRSRTLAWEEISPIAVDERAFDVAFTDDALSVSLRDGRVISVPLVWYPRLLTPDMHNGKTGRSPSGSGIHWPDIDEDLSTEGLLRGESAKAPAPTG